MAVSGVLGKWNLARVEVRCVPPPELYDGLPTLLGIELRNRRRWLPIYFMEVLVAGQAVLFPLVEPGRARRRQLSLTLHGRGWQALPQLTVRSRFPINFFIRSLGLPPERELLVFPAPLPCPGSDLPAPAGRRGSRQNWLRGQEGDISRIGDYLGGEPLKLIHWKLSARHDQLKVKELSAAASTPVVLDLATLPGSSTEQRLRCATFLVIRLLRAGRPVGLRLDQRLLAAGTGRAHKQLLLKALALYGQHQDAA